MKALVLLLLFVFPLGQLLRFTWPNSSIVLHLNDVLVALTVATWLLSRRHHALQLIKRDTLTKPLVLWGLIMFLSLAVNSPRFRLEQIFVSALYPLRFIVYAFIYFVFRDEKIIAQKQTARYLGLMILSVAIFGLLQYVFLPDVSFLKALDWDDHYYRVVSTFLDPGFTGTILAIGLVVIFSLKNISSLSHWLSLTVIYTAFALTYSRASYLMYLVAFAIIGVYHRSLKTFLVAALILAVTLPILPKTFGEGTKLSRENSIFARVNNWKESVEIASRHPIFGVGFDTYRYERRISPASHSGAGADSSFLLVLATTGVVGLASYLFLLGKMVSLGKKDLVFMASFGGILVHSWFNNTLFYPWVMEVLWILLALRSRENTGA